MTVGLDVIDQLTGGRMGTFDVPCPKCGPCKRSARNQRRPVLRVYRVEPNFAGYHCARCGDKGAALDRNGTPPDPMKLARARAEAAERERIVKADRLGLARWLWARREPIGGSIAETYLRSARSYGGHLPETLGFLPGRGDHPPAMIAAFGMAIETDEPGKLAIGVDAVKGVHLTPRWKTGRPNASAVVSWSTPPSPAVSALGSDAPFQHRQARASRSATARWLRHIARGPSQIDCRSTAVKPPSPMQATLPAKWREWRLSR